MESTSHTIDNVLASSAASPDNTAQSKQPNSILASSNKLNSHSSDTNLRRDSNIPRKQVGIQVGKAISSEEDASYHTDSEVCQLFCLGLSLNLELGL